MTRIKITVRWRTNEATFTYPASVGLDEAISRAITAMASEYIVVRSKIRVVSSYYC